MTTGIMLALISLAASQIIGDNVMESIEVTPKIEIVEIPSEFSAFRQVGCDKYANVFGVHIFASQTTSEDKLAHAAGVLAQYLDNDEDGVPDNTRVLSHLVSRNVFIIMPGTQAEMERLEMELVRRGRLSTMVKTSMAKKPNRISLLMAKSTHPMVTTTTAH